MKNKQNLQLDFPVGDYTVICKHCKLIERCPLIQPHVPIVDIARLGYDKFEMQAVCMVPKEMGDDDAFVAECVGAIESYGKEVLDA